MEREFERIPSNRAHLNLKIEKTQSTYRLLVEYLTRLSFTRQSRCHHIRTAHTPFVARSFIDQDEVRLCLDCGLQESGWHNHLHSVLARGARLSKEELMAKRERLLCGVEVRSFETPGGLVLRAMNPDQPIA